MEFFINKNASLPELRLELIQDGRNDFNKFYDKIQNATIVFSMTDVVTGIKKIGRKAAHVILVEPQGAFPDERYYIAYKFSQKETSVVGRFVGQFEMNFLDGTGILIVPIHEELFINVLDGSIRK